MNRLQQLRETAGFSRAELARRSDVTQSAIEQLEAGAHLTGAERAVEIPGETSVEDLPVLLNKLADALGANLIEQGISVTPDELLEQVSDDVPANRGPEAGTQSDEETLPALPLVGISYPTQEDDLTPDARSHNETETPDDIDAALGQMAVNSQITASEEAAETGADEVVPEPAWAGGPASPAAATAPDSAPDFTEPPSTGQAPTGGTETINMAELPDSLPIGVLPDSPAVVETKEISPIANQSVDEPADSDEEFASQETQEIYIPPEVRANLPKYGTDAYEAAPAPDMPGPAPAPETMKASSEAHPEPPVMAEVEDEDRTTSIPPAQPATLKSDGQAAYTPPANLGINTADDVATVAPNQGLPPAPPTQPTRLELEAATPAQDDAPLTTAQPEKQPDMQPYVTSQPTAAEQSRYKLPPSTVIPSIIGVVAALGWYAWRAWRRSKAESERVAPYYKKK